MHLHDNDLHRVNPQILQAQIQKAMEGIDPAGKKRIGFNRFMPVFETVKGASKPMTFEDYVEGMKVFDRDLVGYLNSGELRHLLTFMGMYYVDFT